MLSVNEVVYEGDPDGMTELSSYGLLVGDRLKEFLCSSSSDCFFPATAVSVSVSAAQLGRWGGVSSSDLIYIFLFPDIPWEYSLSDTSEWVRLWVELAVSVYTESGEPGGLILRALESTA